VNEDRQFTEATDQDILKVFDRVGESMKSPEIADELSVTEDSVTYRLRKMQEENLVEQDKTDTNTIIWRAKVAPRLDPEVAEEVEKINREDAVPFEDFEG
jgi:DNA-binding Lrp family transcriptional regulator